jgi:hypothetical protein
MSKTYPNVKVYWDVAAPIVNDLLNSRRDGEIEQLLEAAIAIGSFILQDFDGKRTKNEHLAGRFDSIVVFVLDILRGAHAAQRCLSLASSAVAARSTFEALVNLRFIVTSPTPDLYADRFHRFQVVERLNRHYKGGMPLVEQDVQALTADATEWIDPKTGKPKRNVKWHAEGHTIADLAELVGEGDGYRGLYSLNSLFTHGSSATQKLYAKDGKLQLLSDTKHLSLQSILVVGNAIKVFATHAEFFGVPIPRGELMELARRLNENSDRLSRGR